MHLWYAAFGSNLSRSRFLVYLRGGVPPHSPHPKPQPGARDQTLPTDEWTGVIDAELYFGGDSQRWGGGGVAFLDVDPDRWSTPRPQARVRAYRITDSQLEDVYGQENGLDAAVDIDVAELLERGHADPLTSRYGRLAIVGDLDGTPIVTITSAERQESNSPSFAYVHTIVDGLVESFDLSTDDSVAYLANHGLDENAALEFASRLRDN